MGHLRREDTSPVARAFDLDPGRRYRPAMAVPPPAPADPAPAWGGPWARWAAGALLGVALLSLLKGFGLPNLWAATHWALSWEYGFVKRGLAGTLLRALAPTLDYGTVVAVALAAEVACAVLLAVGGRALVRGGERPAWAALCFAASPGLVFFFHEVGYFDQLGVLAVLVVLALLPRLTLLPGSLLVCGAGAIAGLCHEANLVAFGPLLAAAHSLRYGGGRRALGLSLGVLAVFAGLAWALGLCGVADPATAAALRESLGARCGFRPRFDVLLPLTHGGLPGPAAVASFWRDKADLEEILVATLLPALPAGMALLALWMHEARRRAVGRPALRAGLVLAPLSPLALYLSGIDFQRWDALTLMALFLAILAAYTLAKHPAPPPARARPALTLVVLLGVAGTYPLLDGSRTPQFPFEGHLRHAARALAGREPWITTPTR
jgi:hypothetical protein